MASARSPFASSEVEKRLSTSIETNGDGVRAAAGVLLGIARHARPRGPMELLERSSVSLECGIAGDHRGKVKSGGRGKRQVTLMEADDWAAALREVGTPIEWQERRVNLLVGSLDLPQRLGALIRVGEEVVLRITGECDPCSRMDEVAEGLRAALTPDWRGGALSRVVAGGEIRVGDRVRIEEEA